MRPVALNVLIPGDLVKAYRAGLPVPRFEADDPIPYLAGDALQLAQDTERQPTPSRVRLDKHALYFGHAGRERQDGPASDRTLVEPRDDKRAAFAFDIRGLELAGASVAV